MKPHHTRCFLLATFIAFLGVPLAQAEPETPSASDTEVSARPPLAAIPIYRPAGVGKPARTVGGGSRGPGDGFPSMYVLVPDHVARTASSQPTLLWYIDDVPKGSPKFEFTLLHEDDAKPTITAVLEPPRRAGIHRIHLADYGVRLEPGAEYEWNVALVPDAGDRAKDIVSTGWIDCVERPEGLDARLASEGEARAVFVLADEGLWYDALAALDAQLERNPKETELVEMRAALLRQVGLEAVASARSL